MDAEKYYYTLLRWVNSSRKPYHYEACLEAVDRLFIERFHGTSDEEWVNKRGHELKVLIEKHQEATPDHIGKTPLS